MLVVVAGGWSLMDDESFTFESHAVHRPYYVIYGRDLCTQSGPTLSAAHLELSRAVEIVSRSYIISDVD